MPRFAGVRTLRGPTHERDLVGVTVTSRSSDRVAAVGLHERYRPPPGTYDEMIAADGSIRPHWARFLDGIEGMSDGELARRWRLAERLLHENGLTYTADATTHADRPWALDFVPVLIGADEWRMLEQGLIQRARLLNAILADLYGPQTLLRDGHLPAAVVLGNPQFLRPCHGFRPRDGLYLHVYAADLGRGPDGLWWVLADRTQAPSASASRSRTGSSSPAACPRCSGICTSAGSPTTFRRCTTAWSPAPIGTIREWFC